MEKQNSMADKIAILVIATNTLLIIAWRFGYLFNENNL